MTIYRQVSYTGRVQGVGFRYTVKQLASGYEVVGWVRNLVDGSVELQVGGEEAELAAFLAAIVGSHLGGHIKTTHVTEIPSPSPLSGFEIRH